MERNCPGITEEEHDEAKSMGLRCDCNMGVSKNKGTPRSSTLIGFSIINHPFWGTPILGNIHIWVAIGFGCSFMT